MLLQQLADYATKEKFTWLDINAQLLDKEGIIPHALMPDFIHPVEKGYQIWADALLPLLAPLGGANAPDEKAADNATPPGR